MSERSKAVLALVLASFIGGAVMPGLVRVGVGSIHPLIFNLGRCFFSVVIFLPVLFKYRAAFKLRAFQLLLAVMGLTIGGNIILFAFGISHTTVVASQLLYALLPVTVPALAFVWLREKLPAQKAIGATVAMAGIGLLVLFSQAADQRLSLGSLYGNLLILGAVGCYTTYLVFSKKKTGDFPPILLAAATYLGTGVVMLPLAGYAALELQTWSSISSASIISVVGVAICSAAHIICIQYGIRRVSAMTVAVTTLLAPIFASLSGVLIFHEGFSLILIVSMILVLSGVLMSFLSEKLTVRDHFRAVHQKVLEYLWR